MSKYLIIALATLIYIFLPRQSKANCIVGNCSNGKGTFLYKNGSKYTGSFLQNMPHGAGKYIFPDGSTYYGDFVLGFREGKGTLIYHNTDTYKGSFVQDKISGYGEIHYKNGDKYMGEWKENKAYGQGIYTFANTDRYEGSFSDGNFHGKGKLFRHDGSSYTGEWFHSKKHGPGISSYRGIQTSQYHNMGNIIKSEETFSNVVSNSVSTHKTESLIDCNSIYCHKIKGKYTYGDGSIFVGDFEDGLGNGIGICTYSNGDLYEGEWKNHAPHGNGKMTFKSGNIYNAYWVNGKPVKKVPMEQKQNEIVNYYKSNDYSPSQENLGDIRVFALIVGVATYDHMPSLKYTDDDAYQLYAFLKSPEGGALRDEHIKILIDDGATHKSIIQELEKITQLADANDVVLLYLSGHGVDGGYAPSDFDGRKNLVRYEEILGYMNQSRAKHKLFVADACHSGSMMAMARTPLNVSLDNFYSAYNSASSGTAILMSSKKEEVSLEYGGLRQGVFSHFLIKGIKGSADKNADKLITITELYNYLSTQVKSYTANVQNPSIMGDYDQNMPVGMIR